MLELTEIQEDSIGLIFLHRWTAFVRVHAAKRLRSLSKVVSSVDFTLYDGTVVRQYPDLGDVSSLSTSKGLNEVSITDIAFDTFPIKMIINFTQDSGAKPFQYVHNLNFEKQTTKRLVKIPFTQYKLDPLVLTPYELRVAQRQRDKNEIKEDNDKKKLSIRNKSVNIAAVPRTPIIPKFKCWKK